MSRRLVFKRHAGSQMVSERERTATGKQWQISAQAEATIQHMAIAMERMQNEQGKMRRRIIGGGGSTSGGMSFKGEYNGGPYASQNVVVFVPDGGAAGTYIALKGVPAGIAPDTGNPYWMALPFPPAGIFA